MITGDDGGVYLQLVGDDEDDDDDDDYDGGACPQLVGDDPPVEKEADSDSIQIKRLDNGSDEDSRITPVSDRDKDTLQ